MLWNVLDRAVATTYWIKLFAEYKVSILLIHVSDRSLLKLKLRGGGRVNKFRHRGFFLVEQAGIKYEECGSIIDKCWSQNQEGVSFQGICDRIEETRLNLLRWNRRVFGDGSRVRRR